MNLVEVAEALERKGLRIDYFSAIIHGFLGLSGYMERDKFFVSYSHNKVAAIAMEIINKKKLEVLKEYMIDIIGYNPSFTYKYTDTPIIVYEWIYDRDYKLIRWAELVKKTEECEVTGLVNLEINYGRNV
jgi:hypothetical protein